MSKRNDVKATVPSACVIVKGTVIEGDFKSSSDTRMDGIIKGNLICTARIIMGKNAKIEGNINVQQANISGLFNGDIKVKELLSVSSDAKINGNIQAGEIEVAEGALINGNVHINKKGNSSLAEKR